MAKTARRQVSVGVSLLFWHHNKLLCLSILSVTFLLAYLLPQPTTAQTIVAQDSHGNIVYDNGTIKFVRPIPIGTGTYKTKTDYDDKGLGILYAFARSFVNTAISKPFPFGR